MTYKTSFPNMTRFQREFGAKGVTGQSGIVPFSPMPVGKKLQPINETKIETVRKKFFGK